ncbi:hypothetical protein ACROYT_G006819 [Oculina patagonica]
MAKSDIEEELDDLSGNRQEGDTTYSESDRLKRRAFENSLTETIRSGNFFQISKNITPKAFTKCEKNALLISMQVSYELRRLADRGLPNVEDETKLATSVEEFTNCLIDPLKSDFECRSQFKDCFDDVMETAIELGQKKFFTHPVIDNLKNYKWYGELGEMWTPSYLSIRRWKWMFLDLWCLFDLVLFPFVFTVLYLIHLARAKWNINGERRQNDLYETYRDYFTTPYFVFIRDTLSYLAFLGLHLTICLSPTSVAFSGVEWAIMVFFMGRTVTEIKQFCAIKVQVIGKKRDKLKIVDLKDAKQEEIDEFLTDLDELHRQNEKQGASRVEIKSVNKCTSACKNVAVMLLKKLKNFTRDTWNCLDLITLLVYICTFLLRMATWSSSKSVVNNRSLVVAGYLYGLNTMILTLRVFGQVMETVKGLGTIQIALFSIIKDVATIFWQFVAAVIAFSFAITKVYMSEKSFITEEHDIYPVCSTSGPTCWWTMVKHLCWSLLGIAELETLDSVDSATVTLANLLYAVFLVVGAILLINMMIALLSNTYQRQFLMEWTFKKAITIQTYSSYDPVPVPLNLVSSLVLGIWWLWKKCRRRCKGRPDVQSQTASRHTKELDEVVEKLQNSYFATYGYSFPLTEEGKMDQLFVEAEGNRQIANQLAQRAFLAHQDILPTGQKAWHSMGLKVKGCLLIYDGANSCKVCTSSPQSTTSLLHHGAKYIIPFSKEFPHFEVLVLETGRSRLLEVGVVRKEYDSHLRPGFLTGSVGYHADGNIVDSGREDLTSERVIDVPVVNRGDLIGCIPKFELESDGKVPVVFCLNGQQVTKEEVLIEYNKTTKQLYPYIGMGQDGVQVLAKMTSSGSQGVEGLGQTNVLTEDTTRNDTTSKQSYAAAASNGRVVAIHQELNDVTVQFRRLRDNISANLRNFEDLFYDSQTEFSKLTGLTAEKEVEDVLRKLDTERHKQELACSELVKKIKEDLDKLGEMSRKNYKVVAKAIIETRQVDEE